MSGAMSERLILGPGDDDIEVEAPSVHVDAGQNDRRLGGAGQLDLGFLDGNPQAAQCRKVPRIAAVHDNALGREPGEHEIDQGAVEIAPAEEIVAVMPNHPQETVLGFEQRNIEGTTAQVVYQPRPIAARLGPARRYRGSDRLLDKLHTLEARQPRGFGDCGGLVQLEQCRHRDDRALGRDPDLIGDVLP